MTSATRRNALDLFMGMLPTEGPLRSAPKTRRRRATAFYFGRRNEISSMAWFASGNFFNSPLALRQLVKAASLVGIFVVHRIGALGKAPIVVDGAERYQF